MPLDPQIDALIRRGREAGAKPYHQLSVAEARQSFAESSLALAGPSEGVARVEDIGVPRADGDGEIPVRICNSRAPEAGGTLIGPRAEAAPRGVRAIAHKAGVTVVRVTSARMLGAYGFLRALFEVFDRHRTAVDVVTTSEVSVSLTVDETTALPALLPELEALGSVEVETGNAIVCVVGGGLRDTPGIAGRIFRTISDINVRMTSQGASSVNLTFVVEEGRAAETVRRLHAAFFEG